MNAIADLKPTVGTRAACNAMAIPHASWYRHQKPKPKRKPRSTSPRALSSDERQTVLAHLHSPRFVDVAPNAMYATLLDEDTYVCSTRTMYRILHSNKEVRERRNQLQHPEYHKPELLASRPNEVWSWDITKLRGAKKWNYYHLYVILDIYSRCVVGWAVHERESAVLASQLFEQTCKKHKIDPGQLTVHADRGPSMRSKTMAHLFADLGVLKSHSRPYTSTDNPFSESQFKTMKYRPTYPKHFSCIQEARAYVRQFINWYNHEHRHSGIGLMSPATMHSGEAHVIRERRNKVLEAAYRAHPERFVKAIPKAPMLPKAVWINPPEKEINGFLH